MRSAGWAGVVVWLLGLVTTAGAAQKPPTVPQKPRVAVLEFDVLNGPYNIGNIACDAVSEQLVKSGRFAVYERAKLKVILEEHRLPMVGIVDPSTAVQIGKFTGAQVVICGSVQTASCDTSYSTDRKGRSSQTTTGKVTLHCKVIDATDGSIWIEETTEGTESVSGAADSSSLLASAAREAAGRFVSRVVPPISGVVVKVDLDPNDQYFIINLGSNHGVGPSSEFRVERKGETIFGPDGKALGVEWESVCLARPIPGGISEQMAKLRPGHWEKQLLGLFGWKWKFDAGKLGAIQVGCRVTAVPPQH